MGLTRYFNPNDAHNRLFSQRYYFLLLESWTQWTLLYPRSARLRRAAEKLPLLRKSRRYYDYFERGKAFGDESLFEYCTGKEDQRPEAPNPFAKAPLARAPPVIPERTGSLRTVTSFRDSRLPADLAPKEDTLKKTEEALIERARAFLGGLAAKLAGRAPLADIEAYLLSNRAGISETFSNYKITLELLEIEESDHEGRLTRMDKFTRIQFLFTTVYENLEEFYAGKVGGLEVLENLFSLNVRQIGVSATPRLDYLSEPPRASGLSPGRAPGKSHFEAGGGLLASSAQTDDEAELGNLREEGLRCEANPESAARGDHPQEAAPFEGYSEHGLGRPESATSGAEQASLLAKSGAKFQLPFEKGFKAVPVQKIKSAKSWLGGEERRSERSASEVLSAWEEGEQSRLSRSAHLKKAACPRLQKSVRSLSSKSNQAHFKISRADRQLPPEPGRAELQYSSNKLPERPVEALQVFSEKQIPRLRVQSPGSRQTSEFPQEKAASPGGDLAALRRSNSYMRNFNRYLRENTAQLHKTAGGLVQSLKFEKWKGRVQGRDAQTEAGGGAAGAPGEEAGRRAGQFAHSQRLLETNRELRRNLSEYKEFLKGKLGGLTRRRGAVPKPAQGAEAGPGGGGEPARLGQPAARARGLPQSRQGSPAPPARARREKAAEEAAREEGVSEAGRGDHAKVRPQGAVAGPGLAAAAEHPEEGLPGD